MRLIRIVLLSLLALAASPAQTVVQGGGDALNQALGAASHGDVFRVLDGHYDALQTSLGVTIVCAPNVNFHSILGGAVTVDGLPVGRSFAMYGGTTVATDFAVNFVVRNCAGTVVFDGLTTTNGRDATIESSAAVSFHACRLYAPAVTGSTVVFSDCDCRSLPTSPAIRATRSEIFLAGGRADGPSRVPPLTLPAAPAAFLIDSSLVVAGDGSTTLAAGIGPSLPPAILGDATSSVIVGPRTRILSAASAPISAGRVTVRETPAVQLFELRRVSGQRVDILTEPGAPVATFVDRHRAPGALPFGLLWIDASALVLDSGTAPSSGVRSVLVDGGSTQFGAGFVLQPATLLGSGELVFGAPTHVVVHD